MIIQRNELGDICNLLRKEGKSIVFTNGCFDIIHSGHIYYLYKAKGFGDILVVGLNSDGSVKRLKGDGRPLNNQKDRATVLSALEMVDYVCIFEEDTPLNLIKIVRPDFLVKGGDYKKDEIVGADFVESYGGKVEIVTFIEGKSTTNIIEKMKNSD